MSSTKTPEVGVMAPKSWKSGGKSNSAAPVKPTPLSKTVNIVPATPAAGNAKGKMGRRQIRKMNRINREKKDIGVVENVEGTTAGKKKRSRKPKESSKDADQIIEKEVLRSNWKLSPSLGGRFLQLDPVFAKNEKYIFLAHVMSLKIYSTKTSLVVRTISIPSTQPLEKIASYHIDPENDNNVYIATSIGHLFLWDWVGGKLVHEWDLGLTSLGFISICVDEKPELGEFVGLVYAAECTQKSEILWRIRLPKNPETAVEKTSVYENVVDRISAAQILDSGRIIVVIAGRALAVGNKHTKEQEGKSKWGVFRKYPMTFNLACMDAFLPITEPSESGKGKKSKKAKGDLLGDVVIGDDTGAMHLFHNVLRLKEGTDPEPVIRGLHWHRKKVRSVKWALDGNYIISGGSETVLVLWQIETGHKQYLPHLGSTIERLVVSPRGTSYAILLSDNSIVVLSTTELKPKTNVAGIQAPVTESRHFKVPCVLHPTANRLLLATPSSQTDKETASPYLQTFDAYSDRHVARQALTRTNATTFNSGPEQDLILEPNVAHIAITADGEWLATIDEWKPPKRKTAMDGTDIEQSSPIGEEEEHGREVYLRFWKWSEKKKIWELVTRVDSPHPSSNGLGAEEVFDLVPSPKGHGFATVGADGNVRIWRTKIRTRAGGAQVRGVEGGFTSWGCRRVIMFSKGKKEIELSTLALLDVLPRKSLESSYWGHVAFSEDGSVVAIATPVPGLNTKDDSTVHLADSGAAIVRQSVGGLQVGRTNGLGVLERYLVILGTSKLLVWNLVSSGVQWEISLGTLGANGHGARGHLAVDHHSQTFAVAFPPVKSTDPQKVFIFNTSAAVPIHVQDTDLVSVTALKSSEGGKGYMVLDAEAKIQYISPILAPHASVVHQTSGVEFSLQGQEEAGEDSGGLSGAYLANGPITLDDEMELVRKDVDEDGEGDDGVVDRVVPREALERIFDTVPSYTAGSVEEMFEKVLGLFAKKPLDVDGDDVQGSDDDGEGEGEGEGEDVDMQMAIL